MNRFTVCLCFIVCAIAPLQSAPQSTASTSNVYELPPVIITATQYPISSDKTGKQVRIITEREINLLPTPRLSDALTLATGLHIGTSGGVTSIFSRGTASNLTKILYDGIELKDPITPQGTPYLDALNLDDIYQIEIVEGSQNSLYGNQAIGGVIQFIPKTQGNTVRLWGGYNLYSLGGSYSTTWADTLISLSGSLFRDASLSALSVGSELDSVNRDNYSIRVEKDLADLNIVASYRKNKTRSDLDNSYAQSVKDDPNYYSTADQDLTSVKAELPTFKNGLSTLTLTYSSLLRTTLNPTDNANTSDYENSVYRGQTMYGDLRHKVTLSEIASLTLGVDIKKESGSYNYQSVSSFGPYTDILSEKTKNNYGIYTHHENLNDLLPFQLGSRYENADGTAVFTYDIGIFKQLPASMTLKANFATGFRQATLYETANANSKTLTPETSLTKDIGLEKNWDICSTSIAWFETQMTNQIAYIDSVYPGYYSNTSGLTLSNGLEGAVTFKKMGVLELLRCDFTHYTTKPSNIPDKKFSLLTVVTQGPLSLGTSFLYVGDRTNSASGGTALSPYWLINTKLTYTLNTSASVFVAGENLLNSIYEVSSGYSTPQRNVSIGSTIQLN